jgi:hypothetical protein
MALSGAQVAQVLSQAGFSGKALSDMVAIAYRESRWQPDAHRSDRPKSMLSGDMGLLQINYSHWPMLQQELGLTSKTQLFDPVINARAAKLLYDKGGLAPWGMGSNGWAAGGDPYRGVDLNRGVQAVAEAQQQGLIGQPYSAGSSVTNLGDTSTVGAGGPVSLPSDAKLVGNSFGIFAVFSIGGVNVFYSVPWDQPGRVQFDPARVERISDAEWNQRYPSSTTVNAGEADELGTVAASFGTFSGYWNSILDQVMGFNNPARNDPEVLKVIAELAGRPDMTEAELQNRLQATQWFQKRTQDELEYNSLSDAEKAKRLADAEARMIQTIFQYAGITVDKSDPRVKNYAEQVASGKLGFGAYTEIVKTSAAENPESPWARQQRDEQETQRQRPIDIENTAQRIREQAERWGLQWSPQTIMKWAKDMVEKKLSDEDLTSAFREQAAVLYPWKSPEMETATAAAPWLETYRRVMESQGSLFEPEIQKALTAGQGVWEFEQELKKSPGWLQTKNGQDSIYSTISEMGSRMGFV